MGNVCPFAFAFAVSALSSAHVLAGEYKVDCPPKVTAESIKLVDTPSGWTAYAPSFLHLESVGMIYGEPSLRGDMKGDDQVVRKNVTRETWTFGPRSGTWVSCGYGGRREITLSKPLPDNVTACTVTYTKKAYSFPDIAIRCKAE